MVRLPFNEALNPNWAICLIQFNNLAICRVIDLFFAAFAFLREEDPNFPAKSPREAKKVFIMDNRWSGFDLLSFSQFDRPVVCRENCF